MVGVDLSLHREIVTVNCCEDAVKILMKIVAMNKSGGVKPDVPLHGAEVNKLIFILPRLNKLAHYTGLNKIFKGKILIRDATIQEREFLMSLEELFEIGKAYSMKDWRLHLNAANATRDAYRLS